MDSSKKDSFVEVENVTNLSSRWERDNVAREAAEFEHNLTLKSAFRLYPKAIGFSIIFATAIIMEGYDLSLLGSFYGYTA